MLHFRTIKAMECEINEICVESAICEENEAGMGLRKANDCVIVDSAGPAEMVFDEFWRRGEVALMFGASGAGKSLLAMQAAEAIARGCDVAGFRLDAEP